ncbi:MAG: Sapep family Mn(2+)-dependent dipeptidase [Clostridia bacterium]|nr:Sapep family Mn(2+)-dependent dipeptidase [Clostridia bacterium]
MIDHQLDQKIKEWINAHREELLAQWMELIRIPSVRGESAPGAPFGLPSKKAMDTAAGFYEQAGFSVRTEEENYYALADWGSGAKTIGLFGHCDVVAAGEGWRYTDPFEPVIIDGYLIGRGCKDDKSGVMASLTAMRILKELQIPFNSRIRAYIGPAEESRMPDMVRFVEKEEMPDLSLVPDSSFPCSLGEKTILRFTAEQTTPFRDILDFTGGKAMNVVLDQVTVTLRKIKGLAEELQARIAGKTEYALTVADDTVILKATGIPKHAGHPEGSVNAAALAAMILKECQSLCEEDRSCMAQLAHWLGDYWGNSFGIAFDDPDFGKLTAANGIVRTENGCCSFTTDIRFGTSLDHLETEAALTRLMEESGWRITYMHNRKGFKADPESPIPGTFTAIYKELTGADAKPYYMSGGTYARHLKNAFTVGSSAYDPNSKAICPEMPAGHGGAHQKDEFISIDGHFQGVRVLVHYLLACDRFLNE